MNCIKHHSTLSVHCDECVATETRRADSAEQELRETAGELEKVSALVPVKLLGKLERLRGELAATRKERDIAEAGLTEATALLDEMLDHRSLLSWPDGWNERARARLKSSRAPAQPAAPTPESHFYPPYEPVEITADPLQSFDARVWAREFMRLINDGTFQMNAGPDEETINESLMLAWFANALMRGFDEHRWQQEKLPPAAPAGAPEPSGEHATLRELAQSWRDKAFGSGHMSTAVSDGLEQCAQELDEALAFVKDDVADADAHLKAEQEDHDRTQAVWATIRPAPSPPKPSSRPCTK